MSRYKKRIDVLRTQLSKLDSVKSVLASQLSELQDESEVLDLLSESASALTKDIRGISQDIKRAHNRIRTHNNRVDSAIETVNQALAAIEDDLAAEPLNIDVFEIGAKGISTLQEFEEKLLDSAGEVDGSAGAVSGVYFLMENEEVVYVGQSTGVHSRIGNHISDWRKSFTHCAYVACAPERLNVIEDFFILAFDPPLNSKKPRIDSDELRSKIESIKTGVTANFDSILGAA